MKYEEIRLSDRVAFWRESHHYNVESYLFFFFPRSRIYFRPLVVNITIKMPMSEILGVEKV